MLFIEAQVNRLFLACTKELSPHSNRDWDVILKYIDKAYRQGQEDFGYSDMADTNITSNTL